MRTLTTEDLAALLHITPNAVKDRLARRPQQLPPRIKLPGKSKPLWLEEDVLKWLKQMREAA